MGKEFARLSHAGLCPGEFRELLQTEAKNEWRYNERVETVK